VADATFADPGDLHRYDLTEKAVSVIERAMVVVRETPRASR
jgi:hypothetical protein